MSLCDLSLLHIIQYQTGNGQYKSKLELTGEVSISLPNPLKLMTPKESVGCGCVCV